MIQTKGMASCDDKVLPGIELTVHSIRGKGSPLAHAVRSYFEPRFGHDLTDVRVHVDAASERSARGLNARAYTLGKHIVFGAGQFAPGTLEGKRLLAHELTHVIQQCSPDSRELGVSHAGSKYPMLTPHPMYHSIDIRDREPSGSQAFFATVSSDLGQIASCAAGRDLLLTLNEILEATSHRVFIQIGPRNHTQGPIVIYTGTSPPPQIPYWDVGVPNCIHLAHELIHQLHYAEGSSSGRADDPTEEWRTVGLGRHAHERFSENRIRCEMGQPVRPAYYTDRDDIGRYNGQGYGAPHCLGGSYFHLRMAGVTMRVIQVPRETVRGTE